MNFIIPFTPGNLQAVLVAIPFNNRILPFVKLPFDPAVRIPGCHRLAFSVKPCFTCYMVSVQIRPVNPMIPCPRVDYRLVFQSVIGNRRRKTILSDGVPHSLDSVRGQNFPVVLIQICLFRRLSVFVHLPYDNRIPGGKVHQLPVCSIVFDVQRIPSMVFRLFFPGFFFCCFVLFRYFCGFLIRILFLFRFHFFLSQIVLIPHGDGTCIGIFFSRSRYQFPVHAVVQRAHDLPLAVELVFQPGITVRNRRNIPFRIQEHLCADPVRSRIFIPDLMGPFAVHGRCPVGPVTFAGLVSVYPCIPDFIRVVPYHNPVSFRIKVLFAQDLLILIPLVFNPGVSVFSVYKRFSICIVVGSFYQEPVYIFIFSRVVSVRADHRLYILVEILRTRQVIAAVGVLQHGIPDGFRNHQLVVFVIKALFGQFSPHVICPGLPAVPVRAASPLLVLSDVVPFVADSTPLRTRLLDSAVAFFRKEQASVRVVVHDLRRGMVVLPVVAVYRAGKSFRTGCQLPIIAVISLFLDVSVFIDRFLDGKSLSGVEIQFSIHIIVRSPGNPCPGISVFNPGISLRPFRGVSSRIIPAVLDNQARLVFHMVRNPVQVHRISVCVIFPGTFMLPVGILGLLQRVSFRPVYRLSGSVQVLCLRQSAYGIGVNDLCDTVHAVGQVSGRIQVFRL